MSLPSLRKPLIGSPIDSRAFDLLSLTIAFVLGLHAVHLPWWLDIPLALTLACRWWQRRQRQRSGRVPRWLKLPLLVLLTLAVIAHYGNIFGREPGTALAVGLLILKLLETESTRDARVGISFACFALMTALLFDQGMLTTFVVALGLLPALATLRALEPAQAPATLQRNLLPGLGLLAAALPLALLAFLLVPRLSSPLWGAPSPNEARSGLSDSMSPGGFTELLTDDHPAMRVGFEGAPPPPDQRYFRAYVMWSYDGRSWRYVAARHVQEPAPIEIGNSVSYQINLEPTHQRVLPTLDVPLNAPAQASLRPDREVFADKPVNDPLSYSLRSALHYRLQPTLDERSRRLGLRLPDGFNPRTVALASQWRQRYGNDDAAIVQAALSLFHDGGFRYTLAPAPLGRDAVDDFLFGTHEGFCEHYSSAFTILMRAAGIPARVVTGYQGGYWNQLGHYLLVRNSDAHAWSEVWLAGRGWVRIDPTGAVRPERVELGAAAAAGDQLSWYRSDWLQGLRNHWDIVNRWWDQGVVGFDSLRQHGLLTPFGIRDTDTATLGVLLAISSVLFIVIGLVWALLRRRTRDPLRAALHELERKLARHGIVRRPSEGPQHYLSRAARALPGQRDELAMLMNRYLELRYANDEPPPESLRDFQRAVRDFRAVRVVK
jgi:transglutaminase-like putative cysteine protease